MASIVCEALPELLQVHLVHIARVRIAEGFVVLEQGLQRAAVLHQQRLRLVPDR